VGSDIVLGASAQSEGAVDPHLLAHELAHVAQPSSGARESVGTPGDASERAADRAADAAMRGAVVGQLNASSAAVQRQPLPGRSRASAGDELLKGASPRLASVLVSDTLDAFDTGKADLSAKHRKQLETIAHRVTVLLEPYNVSTLEVIGHADTVGGEPFNLSLGQMRADAVRDELIRLGVPDSMITTGSKGEGEPQAVSTKNETPNARNRRVEVVFHPKAVTLPGFGGTLTPPTPPPESKPIDLTYHPKIDPDGPPPDFFKPIPPLPKGAGPKSVLDVIGEKILDPVIDSVAGKLPKSIRDKLKEGARSAVSAGTAKGARAAAEAAGVTDPAALDAIEKAAEAAIKEKGKPSP
jgi:outer membrane protein OmpA-like peptidoglycan-associated protein